MVKIRMYWGNVCLLSKFEKAHLAQVAAALAKQGLELEYTYFGLGANDDMGAQIRADGEIPDVIVSTDNDLFEEESVYEIFKDDLQSARNFMTVKEVFRDSTLCSNPLIVPTLFIPMVMVVNRAAWGDLPLPESFSDIENMPKAFGGRDNSAGKGLKRQLKEKYGQAFIDNFLKDAEIFEMPVQAYQAVCKGKVPVAIVPTIFAERSDGEELVLVYPEDGAATVPSFTAVKNTLDENLARTVLDAVYTKEFLDFFPKNGDVQPCLEGTEDAALVASNGFRFMY